jgi:hypothetical protein
MLCLITRITGTKKSIRLIIDATKRELEGVVNRVAGRKNKKDMGPCPDARRTPSPGIGKYL